MGLFAAMMTYLAAVLLLVGGMVTATALFFAKPAAIEGPLVEKPRPPLQRAAERQAAEALKQPPSSKAAPKPHSRADTSAINGPQAPASQPAAPQVKAPEPAKRVAEEPRRKKKIAKPAPAASPQPPADSATLGYSGADQPKPRKFVFPLDPEW